MTKSILVQATILPSGKVEQDTILGGAGNDRLDGGEDEDVIRGQEGNDHLLGQGGVDNLFGDAGDDRLEGGNDADYLDGGQGNDHLLGQMHDDEAYGNVGNDIIEGNDGLDNLFGNDGQDVMFGDNGLDNMFGGDGNDTMRGGPENDDMDGGRGDDLIIGNDGDDNIWGRDGNDVLRGYRDNDTIDGGNGQDRVMGDEGDDIITGGLNNDILDGGPGNDTIDGEHGNDELIGGQGIDTLNGGLHDDHLWDAEGIGNRLNGGSGDDVIIGADWGSEDPDFEDDVPFGDIIFGGAGNDTIDSLGGADYIDAGEGNDTIKGGNHGDYIIAGPEESNGSDQDEIYGQNGDDTIFAGADDDSISGGAGTNTIDEGDGNDTVVPPGSDPIPGFSLSKGPIFPGGWEELAGSATDGGLSQVGGFEQAVHAVEDGVFVTWVDTRNGNSEIYLGFYSHATQDWNEISGSASGGGISDDVEQSRRPSIASMGDELLVSWTSVDDAGNSNIEVALMSSGWGRLSNAAQTGIADHSRLVPYAGNSILLGWLDGDSDSSDLRLTQFINAPGCYFGFYAPASVTIASDLRNSEFDLETVEHHAALAWSHGDIGERVIDAVHSEAVNTLSTAQLCPGAIGAPTVLAPTSWVYEDTLIGNDRTDPAVGIRIVDELGPFETATDLYVAWHVTTNREDQVVAMVRRYDFEFIGPWEMMTPDYVGRGHLAGANSISETVGYAAQPDFAMTQSEVYFAWMDDSVHQAGGGDSSIFVMSAVGDDRVLREENRRDASGPGISSTGGALQSLSIVVDNVDPESKPYVAWTEAAAGRPQIYVRQDTNENAAGVIIRQTEGETRVAEGGETDQYTVVLTSAPTANVIITLQSTSELMISPTSLIFTPANWYLSQTVVVRAVDDTEFERRQIGRIRHSVASIDAKYNGIAVEQVAARIRDNDLFIPDFDIDFGIDIGIDRTRRNRGLRRL